MKKILIILALIIVVLVVGFYALNAYIYNEKQGDGVQVDTYEGWTVATNQGISFYYPNPFPGSYVSAVEWPPRVERVVNAYSCAEGEAAVDGAPTTVRQTTIMDQDYCASMSAEGAAGSTYRTYEYSTDQGDMVVRTFFTLRYPQCGNYDEPERTDCVAGQAALDVDTLAARILTSVTAQ